MNIGEEFRAAFEEMVELMGESVLIYKNHNTPSQKVIEMRGLKNNEKGRLQDVMFQFLADPGVAVGDVLAQKGSRGLWRVTEIHDDIISGVFHHFEARVENMSSVSKPTNSGGYNSLVVHGNVHGGIQVASPGALQNNTVSISHIQNDLQQLREIFASSALPPLDKEEAAHALDRIADLSSRPKSPDLLAKISNKIEELKKLAANVTVLTTTASPILLGLWDKLQHALPN